MFLFISGVQSFVRTNDCKSYFYFYFWSAIVRTYEQLQANFFKNFWSAIVRTYEQLQAMSYFIFGVRSESMDRWSWSDAPYKNHLVILCRIGLVLQGMCHVWGWRNEHG